MFYHIIEVSGRGKFPTDMLRYDRCAPYDHSGVTALDARSGEPWTAKFVQYTPTARHRVTIERWRSFMCGARVIESGKVAP